MTTIITPHNETQLPSRLDSQPSASSSFVDFFFGLLLAACTYGLPNVLQIGGDVLATGAQLLMIIVPTVLLLIVRPVAYLYYWVALVLSQNVFSGLWAVGPEAGVSIVSTEAKTISVAIAALVLLPRILTYLRAHPPIAWFTVMYVLAVVVSTRSVGPATFAYARNFLLPLLLMLVIVVISHKMPRLHRLVHLRALTTLGVVFLSVGTLLELSLGTDLWRDLLRTDAIAALSSQAESTTLFGLELNRAAGFTGEPVTTGYIATAYLLTVVLLYRAGCGGKAWMITTGGMSAFLILSAGTKNSLLMVATAVLAVIVIRLVGSRGTALTLFACWASSVIVTLTYIALIKGPNAVPVALSTPIAIIGGDSTVIHFAGLFYGVTSIFAAPLGHGLGVGGNFQRNFSEGWTKDMLDWLSSGSESGIGVLAYQTGIFGLVFFAALVIALAKVWGREATVLLAVWTASALMAESMFGPLVAGIFGLGAVMMRPDQKPADPLKITSAAKADSAVLPPSVRKVGD